MEQRLDPYDPTHADILLACSECAIEWVVSGPPPEAEYVPLFEHWLADVPGTPVVAVHVKTVYTVPPAVRIKEFRWSP